MSDWAFAIELASHRYRDEQRARQQASSNGTVWSANDPGNRDIMRRLVVTLNTSQPPSRQLLTVVRCCQCGHQCGLPTDYSTPYQCLGYSGFTAGYGNSTAGSSSEASTSNTTSSVETSPQSASTGIEEQRIACRHVYCLGCHWLVNGEFRTLHPIEIRDETDYSAQGYGQSASTSGGQQGESSTGRRRGNRRSRG